MSGQANSKYDKVRLVPWDPTDERQFQRMYDQRVACGWRADEVAAWKEKMLKGSKFLYWIVIQDNNPDKEKALQDHLARFPNESEPLTDSATTVFSTPREPTKESFIPVGHIALELIPERNEKYSLPASTIWIMSLYVSWAIQAGGLGRSAMAQMELLGAAAPLNGTAFALDTMTKEFQLSELTLSVLFDGRGHKRPAVLRSNEEWYLRQGYEIFDREENAFTWKHPANGELHPVTSLYMKKALA